ncbi:hypothetical protein [Actinokineospora globicatena]|nr:hypothetical protein [Actinokineospora globicatena]
MALSAVLIAELMLVFSGAAATAPGFALLPPALLAMVTATSTERARGRRGRRRG